MASEPVPFRDPGERPDAFELVDCDFGPDTNAAIATWLQEALTAQVESHRNLHTALIPKWERLYNGQPLSDTKSFPFPNCSNLVVQLIGDRADTSTARVLGYIFATSPLWHFMYPAVSQDGKDSEKKRETIEQFMDTMGYEPGQLDLYRVYGQWCTEEHKLGTSFVGLNWKDSVEAVSVGYSENKKAKFKRTTLYEGPVVEKLAHTDITMDAAAMTIEASRLVTKKVRLKKYDLEERVFEGFYDKAAVEKIIDKPDRQGPELNSAKQQRKQGVNPIQSTVNAEWDIYECYFPWIHQKKKFRLIYSYHLSSRTVMRKIFNFVPQNATPIVRSKLGYRNDGAYGRGFSQLLEKYQQEATDVHNNRIDNSTLANTRFWRLAPSAVNIGSQIEIFPSSAITANKDEVEAFAMADVYQSSFQNEESVMALADARAGIAPAISGAGAGGPGKGKGNPYTAAGTMVATQEGNHRTNLMTSDFRHAHQKLGSMIANMYAKFGTAGKEKMFGDDAHYLVDAFKEYAENKCLIPIRSTSASINKEVEKQNDMLMVGLVQRHYTAQAQLKQAITNPMIPPEAKAYLTKVLGGADRLMYRILRDFGYDQPNDFVPDATETSKQSQPPQGAPPNAPPAQAANPAALASARSNVGGPAVPSGADQGTPQIPGMGGLPGGPGGVAQ